MRKLVEIRNAVDERACDLVREEDGSLCYYMKYRDKNGHAKDVVITVSDMIYPTVKHMTERERLYAMKLLQQQKDTYYIIRAQIRIERGRHAGVNPNVKRREV